MLSSSEANVKFTDEQTRQLEMFQNQLKNLQAEVSIHQKHIKNLNEENVKALELKKSLEPSIIKLNSEIENLMTSKYSISKDIDDSKEMLLSHHSQAAEITRVHQSKQDELDAREKSIEQVELMQEEKQKDLFGKNADLLREREAVEKAKGAFVEACETVLWSK